MTSIKANRLMKKSLLTMMAFAATLFAGAAELDIIPNYSPEMCWSGASMSGKTVTWETAWGGLVFDMGNRNYDQYKYAVIDFTEATPEKTKLEVYCASDNQASASVELDAGITQIKLDLSASISSDIAKIALMSAKPAVMTLSKAVLTDTYTSNPVIWEGEKLLENMNTNFTVKADKLANVKLGDTLTVYFEVGSAVNYGTLQLCYGWTKLSCDSERTNTKPDGNYAPGTTETSVTLNSQADVDGLLASGLRIKGKNVTLKKIMLTGEGDTPVPPVDPDPVDPDPVDPGQDGMITIWSGSVSTDGWTNDVTVDASKFASAKAGDFILVTLKVDEGADYGSIELDDYNYVKLAADGKGDGLDSYGCIQPGVTLITYLINNSDISLLKANGLRVKGSSITIEKIALKSGDPLPDDPEPSDIDTIWTGNVNCGQWKESVSVNSDKFADMKKGDKLSIDVSINAGKGKGIVEISANGGEVLAANGTGTNMDTSGQITNRAAKNVEYSLNEDDINKLKESGLLVRGFAVTVTKIQILRMTESGIFEMVSEEACNDIQYYDLNGLRVENPSSGIFLKVQGGKVSKVLIK